MNFTTEQIVDLIINFFDSYPYTFDNIDSFPEAKEIYENGYAYKDDDNNIRINSEGKDYFHPYIEKYSNIVIKHLLTNNGKSSVASLTDELSKRLSINDIRLLTELVEYLRKNLLTYGYTARKSHSSNGDFIEIEKA